MLLKYTDACQVNRLDVLKGFPECTFNHLGNLLRRLADEHLPAGKNLESDAGFLHLPDTHFQIYYLHILHTLHPLPQIFLATDTIQHY